MKLLLIISFFLYNVSVFSQERPEMLAKKLTANQNSELGKVTSIFKWITENISYRTKPDYRSQKTIDEIEVIDDGPLKPLNERVAETVLNKRVAVCDGYARLFTTLCDYAGIRSEVVVGFAKSGTNKPTQRFGVNHYWNAVMIGEKWFLLDATWASGYFTQRSNEFIREYDEKYFLTAPEIFIQDHYPDDARWTLLPDSKILDEFKWSPFKLKSYSKYHFTSFYPASGIIEASVGDTIKLSIETSIKELGRDVSPGLLIDSAIFSHSPSWVFLKPDLSVKTASQNRFNYIYKVSSPDVEWLYLMYNDDLVLRYKINVKKKA